MLGKPGHLFYQWHLKGSLTQKLYSVINYSSSFHSNPSISSVEDKSRKLLHCTMTYSYEWHNSVNLVQKGSKSPFECSGFTQTWIPSVWSACIDKWPNNTHCANSQTSHPSSALKDWDRHKSARLQIGYTLEIEDPNGRFSQRCNKLSIFGSTKNVLLKSS